MSKELRRAERLFSVGDVGRAERIVATLIETEPSNSTARLLYVDILLAWEGRAEEAERYLKNWMPMNGSVTWHRRLQEALIRQGKLEEAVQHWNQSTSEVRTKYDEGLERTLSRVTFDGTFPIVTTDEEFTATDWLLGRALNGMARYAEAEIVFDGVVNAISDPAPVLVSLLAAKVGQNDYDGVRSTCQRLIQLSWQMGPARRTFFNGINTSILRPLSKIQPENIRTKCLLAAILMDDPTAIKEAEEILRLLVGSGATDPYFPVTMAIVNFKIGNFEQLTDSSTPHRTGGYIGQDWSYWRTLALTAERVVRSVGRVTEKGEPSELFHLASSMAAQGNFRIALDLINAVILAAPEWIEAHVMRISVLGLLGEVDEALDACQIAAEIDPDDPGITAEMGLCYLALGKLDVGWRLDETRLNNWKSHPTFQTDAIPAWQGEDINESEILVWREEGIGDEIRLATCLTDFVTTSGGIITWQCSSRLVNLFRRSFPEFTVVGEDEPLPDDKKINFHVAVGSLPGHVRKSLDAFPTSGKYLTPDPEAVNNWRVKLDRLGTGKKVGIGWRSLNSSWLKAPMTSELSDWDPILKLPGVHLINLQCDNVTAEITASAERVGVQINQFTELDLKNDLDEVAALMVNLDLIISCRCWLVHLAGALGVPVMTFSLPPNAHMFGLTHNPWAPDTEIIYGDAEENWQRVLAQIAGRVGERLNLL